MKNTVLALAALALLQTALAHSHSPKNHAAKRNEHVKRDHDGSAAATAEVIVWVDQFGHTLSVETRAACTPTQPANANVHLQPQPTTLLTAAKHTIPREDPAESTWLSYDMDQYYHPETYPVPTQPSYYPPPTPTSEATSGKYGISYSPYRDDGTCKSQEEVDADLDKLADYPLVRIYGVDCNQVETVTTAAKQHGMKVFAGVYDLNNLQQSLQKIIDATQGDWSPFDTISIGNELVLRRQNTPSEVVAAVNTARAILCAAGYEGPVVTVDTFNTLIQHPELCEASDYCAANCHAFFDASVTAEEAGSYVKEQAERVSEAAGGKKTIITESGWPYAGEPNGAAVPSKENQDAAIESLKNSFPDGGIILFSAFDDKWKTDNSYTFDTEKFWGLLQ